MKEFNKEKHWENIYTTKQLDEVIWYQATPQTSLDFVSEFNVPLTAKIIDVGGGDSLFVDHLINLGYTDITVLDISKKAIKRAQERLGDNAKKVKWIVADAVDFKPTEKYDFWHDRAAFHFMTDKTDIEQYINTVNKSINVGGALIIGTFPEDGPTKCSGIEIKQYSEQTMTKYFNYYFEKEKCINVNHETPFDAIQKFIFCSFKKKA